jgi:hypothetical protein
VDLIRELETAGYTFTVEGDNIRYALAPGRKIDPNTSRPILEQLKQRKPEALAYLREQETPAALWQAVAGELGKLWQPGTRAWLEKNHPDLAGEIDRDEAELNRTWAAVDEGAGTIEDFKAALETWRQANLRAIQAYRDSLPLVMGCADPGEIAKAREMMKRKGYFLMDSPVLGERVAVVEKDADRRKAPQGCPDIHLRGITAAGPGCPGRDHREHRRTSGIAHCKEQTGRGDCAMNRRLQALRSARKVLNAGFSFQSLPAEDGTLLPALALAQENIGAAEAILEAAGFSLEQMAVVVTDTIVEMRLTIEKGLDAGPLEA